METALLLSYSNVPFTSKNYLQRKIVEPSKYIKEFQSQRCRRFSYVIKESMANWGYKIKGSSSIDF